MKHISEELGEKNFHFTHKQSTHAHHPSSSTKEGPLKA